MKEHFVQGLQLTTREFSKVKVIVTPSHIPLHVLCKICRVCRALRQLIKLAVKNDTTKKKKKDSIYTFKLVLPFKES